MSTIDPELWPIDFSKLGKGAEITLAQLEDIFGIKFRDDPTRFSFMKLRLRNKIRDIRFRDHGEHVTVAEQNGALCVLEDPAAVHYWKARRVQSVRGLICSVREQQCVDRSNLSKSDLNEHQRELNVGANYISAMVEARKRNNLMGGDSTGSCPSIA